MLKGYKTLIFNALMAAVFVIRSVWPEADVPDAEEVNSLLDNVLDSLDYIITVAGNLWLRFKTTTPVFNKVPA